MDDRRLEHVFWGCLTGVELDIPKSPRNGPYPGVVTDVVVRRQRNVGGVRRPSSNWSWKSKACVWGESGVGDAAGNRKMSGRGGRRRRRRLDRRRGGVAQGAGSSISDGDDGAGAGAGPGAGAALPRGVGGAGASAAGTSVSSVSAAITFGWVCLLQQSYAITSAVGSDASQPSSMFKMTAD